MTTPTPHGAAELPVVAWLYESSACEPDTIVDSPPETMQILAAGSKSVEPLVKLSDARAAIQQAAGAVAEGWKLVPTEPTENMLREALDCQDHDPKDPPECEMRCLYQAMLAAVPTPPVHPASAAGSSDHFAACDGGGVKVRALIEELEIAAGRITQYSNSPLDGLLQAAANALRAACGHEWKPIETAPKWQPGTEREFVLLWCPNAYNVEHVKVGYVEARGAVYSMYEATGEMGSEPQRDATHWMPMPPTPRPKSPTAQINPDSGAQGEEKL